MVVSSNVPVPEIKKKNRRREGKKSKAVSEVSASSQDEEMIHDEGLVDGEVLQFSSAGPSTFESTSFEPRNSGDEDGDDADDAIMIDVDGETTQAESTTLSFPPLSAQNPAGAAIIKKSETRRVPIPPHRMTPLKNDWINIFGPLTEMLGLQVRMNVQRRCVEIRVSVSEFFPLLSVHSLI